MPHRIDIMAQGEMRAGMAIGVNGLVVQLQDVPGRVERLGAIRVHHEVDNCLVGEKNRLSGNLFITLDA